MRSYKGHIVTYNSDGKLVDVNGYITVKDNKIVSLSQDRPTGEIIDYEGFVLLPGFVDTHIHLPQINIRGKWSTSLLKWLEDYVFPEEQRFLDAEYARKNSRKFFNELSKNGTTSAMVYGPPSASSTDVAFEEAHRSGLRIMMGQTLMDQNVPEPLKTRIADARKDVRALAEKWNTEHLSYTLTLRFAPACSMELMRETAKIARLLNLRIQTHISEQEDEVALVKTMYGAGYAEVYDNAGVLTPRTVLAHGIHLTRDEMQLIASRGSKIAHCPSSNFFLHSGVMPLAKLEKYGIDIGMGSDVAAGPFLNMLPVLRDAYYANPISPRKAFYLLTLGGAKVLGLEKEIGTLEPGKQADFVVLKLHNEHETVDSLLSELMFLSDDRNVVATYVGGKKIYG